MSAGADYPTDWCVADSDEHACVEPSPSSRPEDKPATPVDGRVWLEHLSPDDCWAQLSKTPVGRLGVLVDSAPEIYPVNYVVDGRSVVFRSDAGGKLRGLDRSPSVSFEVDGIDRGDETGWSVLVKGQAAEVDDAGDLRRLATLTLRYWGIGDKVHWVRIVPTEVTGRRIHRHRVSRPSEAST